MKASVESFMDQKTLIPCLIQILMQKYVYTKLLTIFMCVHEFSVLFQVAGRRVAAAGPLLLACNNSRQQLDTLSPPQAAASTCTVGCHAASVLIVDAACGTAIQATWRLQGMERRPVTAGTARAGPAVRWAAAAGPHCPVCCGDRPHSTLAHHS